MAGRSSPLKSSRAWFPPNFHSPLFSSPSAFLPSSDAQNSENATVGKIRSGPEHHSTYDARSNSHEISNDSGNHASRISPIGDQLLRKASAKSQRDGRISVATPDLLPTDHDQDGRDQPKHNRFEKSEFQTTKSDAVRPHIIPNRFHPELFNKSTAFLPSNNPPKDEVVGSKPLTQVSFSF